MPMLAETLSSSTHHTSQNCGVRLAMPSGTKRPPATTSALPGGAQPGAGRRKPNAPAVMNSA